MRVEALPEYELEGRVVGIAPLPASRSIPSSPDVQNFVGRVQLQGIPQGLRPGMTGQVEILTTTRPDALVIPSEALSGDEGREFCYVAGDDGPERRSVTIGESTETLREVTAGLVEGERVFLDPKGLEHDPDVEIASSAGEPSATESAATDARD